MSSQLLGQLKARTRTVGSNVKEMPVAGFLVGSPYRLLQVISRPHSHRDPFSTVPSDTIL